jgi:hypothetical protein
LQSLFFNVDKNISVKVAFNLVKDGKSEDYDNAYMANHNGETYQLQGESFYHWWEQGLFKPFFERLNKKTNEENESEVVEDLPLFGRQFKGKCRNFGDLFHEAQDCKNKTQVETKEPQKMLLTLLIVID